MIATGQTLKVMEEVKGRSLWVDARRACWSAIARHGEH
jgi:hypothetical protein